MFCTNCGSELRDGVKFCTVCGTPVKKAEQQEVKPVAEAPVAEAPAVEAPVTEAPVERTPAVETPAVETPVAERPVYATPEAATAPVKKNSAVVPVLITIIILLIAAIIACIILFKDNIGVMLHDNWGIDILYSGDDDDEEESESVTQSAELEETTEAQEAATEEESIAEVTTEQSGVTEAEWCKAYADYLSAGDYTTYQGALIYVNNDEIPEMVLIGDCEAAGNLIVTYDGKKTDELQTSRLYFEYIEKENRVCNSDGNSGYYYDLVYSIEDGKWSSVAEGFNSLEDYESDILNYEWDGISVSKDVYEASLGKVFDRTRAKVVRDGIEYNKFFTSLVNERPMDAGIVDVYFTDSTDIHTYDIRIGDVSWYEAQDDAIESGGYLVHINSIEEYNYIVEMIENAGMHNYIFWLGATRTDYFSHEYTWAYKDRNYQKCAEVLEKNHEYDNFWLPGEPSYSSEDANGVTMDEEYLDMFYSKKQGRFVWNDVPSDIISIVPSYAGKVAYIVEIE